MTRSEIHALGMLRVGAFAPIVNLGHPLRNELTIASMAKENSDCDIMVFPELSISGYTCADLFGQQSLLDECEEALIALAEEFAKID